MSHKPKPHEPHEPSPQPTTQDILVAVGELHHRLDQVFTKLKLLDAGQDDLLRGIETVQQLVCDTDEYDDDSEV